MQYCAGGADRGANNPVVDIACFGVNFVIPHRFFCNAERLL